MEPEQVTDLMRQTLLIALEVSAPLLVIAMVVGFVISIFQSVTQINEMTLTFVPKIIVFSIVLMILFPWILKVLVKFTNNVLIYQWDKVINLSMYAG
jgi:flagellar biosynthesis protein FliQ